MTPLTVTGAVTDGAPGRPFGRTSADIDALGYVEEEWFVEGEALRYALDGEMTRDGCWSVVPDSSAPFRTRVLVYRPRDPEQCSGVAVLCWNNVSAGYDVFSAESAEIFASGHALVAVTAQKVGVHGLESTRKGLVDWDPQRYGTLHHPGDDWSYDIFTQVARAVRAGDLGELRANRLIALGASQSAGRVASYHNAIQPQTTAFDAFFLQIWFGVGTAFNVGDAVLDLSKPPPDVTSFHLGRHMLRSDLDVPVFVVNSELEASPCFNVRQPDSDHFRYWEAAATSHVSTQVQAVRAAKYERDFGKRPPSLPTTNRVPMTPLYDAALSHLVRWIDDGQLPPTQPRIEFAGDPAQIQRDEHGIALGGVRLPQAEVPIAHNSAIPADDNVFHLLNGSWQPFPPDKLQALYGDRAGFLGAFEEAARAAVKAGVLLDRDVDALIAQATDELTLSE